MPEPQPIPFNTGQLSGYSSLAGAAPLCQNALRDGAGAMRPRPGMEAWADFPSVTPRPIAITGMCAFRDYLVFVYDDGYVYAWKNTGGVVPLSASTTAASIMQYAARPTFAQAETMLVIAAGGAAQRWDGIQALCQRLSGAPAAIQAQAAAIAQRVVLADTGRSGLMYWSRPGTPETWRALDFAEAEAKPDPIVALSENTNELWAFGTQTVQAFAPDPQVTFAPLRTINRGCGASASVIRVDDGFAWFTEKQDIVYSPGRGCDSIAKDIGGTLNALGTTADCWGFRAVLGPWDLLVWVFPTEGRTFCYERNQKKWSEWMSIDSRGEPKPWAFTSYYHWDDNAHGRDLHLIGTADGRILQMSPSLYSEDGSAIPVILETGALDRGSMRRKVCDVARFKFVRGKAALGATEPTVEIGIADDEREYDAVRLGLGGLGDAHPVLQLRPFGMYTTRRWRLRVNEQVEWALAGAEEEFTTMGA